MNVEKMSVSLAMSNGLVRVYNLKSSAFAAANRRRT